MVKDAAIVPLIDPVRVDRYLVGGGWAWLTVRHDQIRSISLDGIYLRDENLTPYHSDEYMLRAGPRSSGSADHRRAGPQSGARHRCHVSRSSRKPTATCLWVLDVDIGMRSIFRRLVQGVMPPRWIRRLQAGIPPHSIRWEFCNILEPDPQRRLRLNISNRLLEDMHPADLADIVEELSPEDREAIFENIDSEVAADALSEVDPDIQASILESLETEKAADIVEEMAPRRSGGRAGRTGGGDHRRDSRRDGARAQEPRCSELLEFEEDTAGGMMNTEYVALHGDRHGGRRHARR